MTIILSVSQNDGSIWAAGPEGLFRKDGDELVVVPQPEQQLYCCCATHDRVLVGGLPHVVAYSRTQEGDDWQAGWVDNVEASVLTFAPDPMVEDTGVILAGTDGGGVLRSVNHGGVWYSRNFGLQSFVVLSIAWAPVAPENAWPRWRYVFAATEEGIYHSPNGGRGWKRSKSDDSVFQVLAVSPAFHDDGVVLAGAEGEGLYRSTDKGHTFTRVEGSPAQVNALAAVNGGWMLSDDRQLWSSNDGVIWSEVEGSAPALVLIKTANGLVAGGENGLVEVGA